MDKKQVCDPVSLHMFVWRHFTKVIEIAKLVRKFPEWELWVASSNSTGVNFTNSFLEYAVASMVAKLRATEESRPAFMQWYLDVCSVLSVVEIVVGSVQWDNRRLLEFLSKLVKDIVLLAGCTTALISEFLPSKSNAQLDEIFNFDYARNFLDIVEQTHQDVEAIRRAYFSRLLAVVSVKSPLRSRLYQELFSGEPLLLVENILGDIILEDDDKMVLLNLFIPIAGDANAYTRMKNINNAFSESGIFSPTAVQLCDALQRYLYPQCEEWFGHCVDLAMRIVATPKPEPLSIVCLIAFLKVTVATFWKGLLEERSFKQAMDMTLDITVINRYQALYQMIISAAL
ncbi:hypothetical protein K493DRAFT_309278 [Basidiobolus meristosporus CBS 931.73]|uniref:Uncharacterized protein n=1 Tax=Basidiobolus meristosporus CBS 931.73 TaxID=1314790 RepID=A0A1Y1WE00_9FUNG|nr:hypothetical protein K493DRAFT_309278 [Basidiobolus meristosporus CBS 931.73]|eukprot:ORX71743.1 hypothetical protein K493DRAFT_309278 [Basidiobolus meristosporus CBS 931.73]